MEEMLKIIYRNFINEEDESTSSELRLIRKNEKLIDEATEKIGELLNPEIADGICDKIYEGLSDIIEAAFCAGFSRSAMLLSNGKIVLMPND